jgi:hypothetical protein
MKLSKLVRFVGLSLIVAATALPASAARRCSCDYCQTVPSETPCNDAGNTTCGAWLSVTLCPPVG